MDARDVEVVDHGVLREGHRDRRRDEQEGAAVRLDAPQERQQVELRHRHERRALAEREVQQHRHPVDVEERQHGEDAIVAPEPDAHAALVDVGDEVAVREHDALRHARRP